jgi:serine/threonine-protein kinase
LRADHPLDSLPNDAARTIARALQTYGMFLADGGNITLMGESDHFAETTWASLGLGSHDLMDIDPNDFEVLPYGEVHELTYECVRAE